LGDGNYVVYIGTGTSLTITGLTNNTDYTIYAYEFNALRDGLEQYLTTSATNNPKTFTTLLTVNEPSIQATNAVLYGSDRIAWVASGDATHYLVVMKQGSAVDANPVNGTTYTADKTFGNGSVIGTGNYVLAATTSLYVNRLFNLTPGVTYYFKVFAYNIAGSGPKYNTSNATGNPSSGTIPVMDTYYSYKETAFLTRRDATMPYSRCASQIYATCDWIGSTHHHVFLVSEGDLGRLKGLDRTIRYKRALANDPKLVSSWVPDGPADAYGDIPSFLDARPLVYPLWTPGSYNIGDRVRKEFSVSVSGYESTINGNTNDPETLIGWTKLNYFDNNQCWMMSVVEHGGYQYGIYVANAGVSSRYSVGMIVSNDEFATYSRLNSAIIPEGSSFSAYYCHVHPAKVSGYWYMFVQNYVPSLIEDSHLYVCQIWRTANDPSPTGWTGWTALTTSDVFGGQIFGGAVDISQSWESGGRFYALISPHNYGENGAYNAKPEGETVYKTTYPVGNRILLISWDDWTNFKNNFAIEGEIYRTEQHVEIETRSWCPIRTFGSEKFIVSSGFIWRGQTQLTGIFQMEPEIDSKILTTDSSGSGITIRKEIYPAYVKKLFLPHRSYVNDVLGSTPNPYDVLADTSGTVVGSPRASMLNYIQCVDLGYVSFPNFSFDTSRFAVKIAIRLNTNTDNHAVVAMGDSWYIQKSNILYNYEVVLKNGSLKKKYRFSYASETTFSELFNIGFIWDNGTLKCCVLNNLDVSVTKLNDDTFTSVTAPTGPIIFGGLHESIGTNIYARTPIGPLLFLDGSNATPENYKFNDLIGY